MKKFLVFFLLCAASLRAADIVTFSQNGTIVTVVIVLDCQKEKAQFAGATSVTPNIAQLGYTQSILQRAFAALQKMFASLVPDAAINDKKKELDDLRASRPPDAALPDPTKP